MRAHFLNAYPLDDDNSNARRIQANNIHQAIMSNRAFLGSCLALKHGLQRLTYIRERSLRSIMFIDKLFIGIDIAIGFLVAVGKIDDQLSGMECAQATAEECYFILNHLSGAPLNQPLESLVDPKEMAVIDELNKLDREMSEYISDKSELQISRGVILAQTKCLNRLKHISDPCIRISSFLERILFIIEIGTSILESMDNEVLLPELKAMSSDISNLFQREIDILIEYISTPHTSPDHPCGRKLMEAGQQSWDSHIMDT